MANIPAVGELVNQMIAAGSGILKKDLALVEGFSKSQLKKIAEQTVWFGEADAMDMFKDNQPLRDHFLKGIEDLTRLFLQTLQGILLTTLEKIWNAIVGVIWGALDAAAGFVLPRPIF